MGTQKIIRWAVFLLILTVILSPLSCQQNPVANMPLSVSLDYSGALIWDHIGRTYKLHIPACYDKSKPMPLVIILHGGAASAEQMQKLTNNGFNTLSEKEGFIAVYPEGVENRWNDGRKEVNYRAYKDKINDVGFISALIDHLMRLFNIDVRRVYVTGISNGAMMAHRLGMELSDKITAIAPVAGNIPLDLAGLPDGKAGSTPQKPVAVLIMNNTKDPLMPWGGGDVQFLKVSIGKVLSTEESVKYWVTHNQCAPQPVITQEPDKDPADGTKVRKEIYANGKAGTEVVLYAIEEGGHTWPGGFQYLPEKLVGKTSKDIDATEVIWNFFKSHQKE